MTFALRRLLAPIASLFLLTFSTSAFAADPDDLLAWVSISSLADGLVAADLVVEWTGKPVKPSAMALPALNQAVTAFGFKDAAWLDTTRPIRALLFDAPQGKREQGSVLAIPVKDVIQFADAAGNVGAGQGHTLVLQVGPQTVYVDTVPGYAIFALDPARFAKVQTWLGSGVLANKGPGLLSIGVDVRNAVHAYEPEVQAGFAKLDDIMTDAAAKSAGEVSHDTMKGVLDLYVGMLRKFAEEMDALEIFVDLRGGQAVLGYRATAVPSTSLEQLLTAGRGREVAPVAAYLPKSSYAVILANEDQAAKRAFFGQTLSFVGSLLNLDKPGALATMADYNAMMDQAKGDGAFAFFVDGDAAFGLLAVSGYKDGKLAVSTGSRLARQLFSVMIDYAEAQDKKKADAELKGKKPKKAAKGKGKAAPKGADVDTGEGYRILRQALKEDSFKPVLAALTAKLPPTVKLTQSVLDEGTLHCDTLTLAVDWKAFPDPRVRIAQALLGNEYNAALCVLPNAVLLAMGPNALQQARRVAAGQSDGLANLTTYKRALAAAPAHASQLFYLHVAPLLQAVQEFVPPKLAPQLKQLAAIEESPTWGVGLNGSTMEARFSVPVSWIRWFIAFAKSEGTP